MMRRGARSVAGPLAVGLAFPTHHVGDFAPLNVIDKPGDHLKWAQVGLGGKEVNVLVERSDVIVDGEEPEIGTRKAAQFVIGHPHQSALGVLHHYHGVHPEHVGGQRQAAQHVVGDSSARVAQYVGFAEV